MRASQVHGDSFPRLAYQARLERSLSPQISSMIQSTLLALSAVSLHIVFPARPVRPQLQLMGCPPYPHMSSRHSFVAHPNQLTPDCLWCEQLPMIWHSIHGCPFSI